MEKIKEKKIKKTPVGNTTEKILQGIDHGIVSLTIMIRLMETADKLKSPGTSLILETKNSEYVLHPDEEVSVALFITKQASDLMGDLCESTKRLYSTVIESLMMESILNYTEACDPMMMKMVDFIYDQHDLINRYFTNDDNKRAMLVIFHLISQKSDEYASKCVDILVNTEIVKSPYEPPDISKMGDALIKGKSDKMFLKMVAYYFISDIEWYIASLRGTINLGENPGLKADKNTTLRWNGIRPAPSEFRMIMDETDGNVAKISKRIETVRNLCLDTIDKMNALGLS